MVKYFVFFILFLVISFNINIVRAQEPQAKPVSIAADVQAGQGVLTGTLKITNPNQIIYPNAYYVVKLQGEDVEKQSNYKGQKVTEITQGQLISYETSGKFTLGAGDSRDLSFNLKFSPAIPPGSYKLQVSLFGDNDRLLGSMVKEASLTGTGGFLDIKNCVIVADKVEYDPISGPNVAPKAEVYGKCQASNLSASAISAYPQAEYAVNSVAGFGDSTEHAAAGNRILTFPARSTTNIILPLPALEVPGVYEALAYLKDSRGNIVSPKKAFRWVIAGESSLIRSISIDKTEYKKGEIAKVTVGADPSMDLFWKGGGPTMGFADIAASSSAFVQPKLQGTPLSDASISVLIKNGAGLTCGKSEKKVDINPNQNIWPDQTLDVTLESNCANPSVVATVKNNGVELASKEVKMPVVVAGDKRTTMNYWIGGVLVLLLALSGAGFYFWKKKKFPPIKPNIPATLTVFLALGLFHTGFGAAGLDSFTPIKTACAQSASPSASLIASPTASASATPTASASASVFPSPSSSGTEIGPGSPVSVHYEGIKAYRPNQACPGPAWRNQPQLSDGAGGCILDMLSGWDETNFTFLDTQDQITYSNGAFKVNVSGQFKGFGCGNTRIGLIIRAYVNGTNAGVKINGGGNKAIFPNLAQNGGGSGTDVNLNLTVTPGGGDICGPQDLKIELIPFVEHIDIAASDFAEDNLIPSSDVPGWQNVTYANRRNCGVAGQSCWGVLKKTLDTIPCVACGDTCATSEDCTYAANGCVACLPGANGTGKTCQPPPACNENCTTSNDCEKSPNGCTACLPNNTGTGTVCSRQPACNVACTRDDQCIGTRDGCTACVSGVCRIPPACGIACTRDDQCAGAKDGCVSCKDGVCKVPPACGIACQTRAQCTGAKDGCSECLEGTCTDYSDSMCKCDGITADIVYPSNSFNFEAFGKIDGANAKKAEIADITFRMTRDNQVVAKSNPITPTVVESSANKVRFKAAWSTAPPAISRGSTYRVFADVRCKPKKIIASGGENFTPSIQLNTESLPKPPVGLKWALEIADKLFKNKEWLGRAVVGEVMAQLGSPSPSGAQNNLQLQTLNFVKLMDTDNCRFVMFKFDETLF